MAWNEFELLSNQIRALGSPYEGGISLQLTASDAKLVCKTCGRLEQPELPGWSSDWHALCRVAMDHAALRGADHEVALSHWNGAVYAPPPPDYISDEERQAQMLEAEAEDEEPDVQSEH